MSRDRDGIVWEEGVPGRRVWQYVPQELPENVAAFMADVRAARDRHGVEVSVETDYEKIYLEVDGIEFRDLDDVPTVGAYVFVPLNPSEALALDKQEAKARRKAFQRSLPGVPRGRFRVEGA